MSKSTGQTLSKIIRIIRKLREEKGLSQEKLARLVDVSNNTVVNIEAGKQKNPTIKTLKKL